MTPEQLLKKIDYQEGDKIYVMRIRENLENGKTEVRRINHGIQAWELLGRLEVIQLEIIEQVHGIIKPKFETVDRIILEDEKGE